MSYFILNLFFALSWMLINASFTSADFLIGFVLGYVSIWITQPLGRTSYFRTFSAFISLTLSFLWELIVSVLRVTYDVITPTPYSDPDIVYVPLDAKSDLEITLLANMVSLTPGTLSLNVSEDKNSLIVHAMFAPDHQSVIDSIKERLEKKLLRVTRD